MMKSHKEEITMYYWIYNDHFVYAEYKDKKAVAKDFERIKKLNRSLTKIRIGASRKKLLLYPFYPAAFE